MSQDHIHDKTGNIKFAFFLNLGFTIFEIVGDLWTNSLAILSDAIHFSHSTIEIEYKKETCRIKNTCCH